MLVNPVLPGAVYLLTRKVKDDLFRLRPHRNKFNGKDEIEQIVGYCVAVAAQKYEVDVYSISVMANHLHIEASQSGQKIINFMTDVHRNIAQCMNAKQKTEGRFWSPEPPGRTWQLDSMSEEKAMLYVMTNPVKHGTVRRQKNYPGFTTTIKDLANEKGKVYKMPPYFFKRSGSMPRKVRLKYAILPRYSHLKRESYAKIMARKLAKREDEIDAERDHKPYLGKRRILKVDPFSRPKGKVKRGGLNPAVAAKDKEGRIKGRSFIRNFRIARKEAFKRYKEGERQVVFPYGTYKIALHHEVVVEKHRSREAQALNLVLPGYI